MERLILFGDVAAAKAAKILGVKTKDAITASNCTLTDPHDNGDNTVTLSVAFEIGKYEDGQKHSARGKVTLPVTPLLEGYLRDMEMVPVSGRKTGWYPLAPAKAAAVVGETSTISIDGVERYSTPIKKVVIFGLEAARLNRVAEAIIVDDL